MNRKRADSARRRGVAMILVMGAVAIVFAVGMSLLAGLPVSARASTNLIDRDEAVYLAESGLVEARYRIESAEPGDPVWPGVTGRAVDGLDGTYDVAVVDLGEGVYRVDATGHAAGRTGRTLTRTVSLTIAIGQSGLSFNARQTAILQAGFAVIPTAAEIVGDLHVNGRVFNFGNILGTLTATDRIYGDGEQADPVDLPEVDLEAYENYQYSGQSYGAAVYDSDSLPSELEPIAADNPLGVVVVDGDLTLTQDVEIDGGILVVRGRINLNGHSLEVEGDEDAGHIALLAEDGVYYSEDNSQLKVEGGPAYLGGDLMANWRMRDGVFKAESGLFMNGSMPLFFDGEIEIDYPEVVENGSASVNFFGSVNAGAGGRTVTVLNYDP